ncbi:MAG TPA: hypothetical protein VGR35_23745 [Tepidisphaeraceae bacterium]|nr:hypothetical protein [Tepidisphaeraceae bacterium]
MTTRQKFAAAACGVVLIPAIPALGQTSSHWTSAVNGNWNDATKWSTPSFPNNGSPNPGDTYNAFIEPDGTYTVTMNAPVAVHDLTFDAVGATFLQPSALTLTGGLNVNAGTYRLAYTNINGGSVIVAPGATFNMAGTLVNSTFTGVANVLADDTFQLSGASRLSNAIVRLGQSGSMRSSSLWINNYPNDGTLAGTGSVIFDGTGPGMVRTTSGSLTIDPGITIRTGIGDGSIDTLNQPGGITNKGIISAQTAGRSITVANTFASWTQNLGTLQAINGGRLAVRKLGGSAGDLVLSGNSTMDLSGHFTLDRPMTLSSGSNLLLGGSFSVTEPLIVGAGAALTLTAQWSNSAPVTVDGATVTFQPPQSGTPYSHTGTAPFTVSNSTVNFRFGTFPRTLVDTYLADGNTVTLGSSGWLDNRDDTLTLNSTTGSVALRGGSLWGGTATTVDGTRFTVGTGGGAFYNVDSSATVVVESGRTFQFGDYQYAPGVSVNRGTITTTGGTINLTGQWSNQGAISLTGGKLAINGPATSMGTINLNNTALDIASTINGAQFGSLAGTMSNVTLLSQARLDLGGGTLTPTAATGPIYLKGGMILNGTVAGSGSNKLRTDGGGWFGFLDNVTLASDLSLVPEFKLIVFNGLTLANDARVTITNNGSEFHQHSGLYMNYGTQTLGGTGQVVFDGTGSSGMLRVSGAAVTVAPNILVRTGSGSGYIAGESAGITGNGRINNEGTIRADGAGRRIEFRELDGFENTGRLEATNGGKLFFNGGTYYLSDWANEGTIHLHDGNVTITGQTFTNAPAGRIEGTGTLDVSGTTFVNEGFIAPGLSPGQLTIEGNLMQTENGVIAIEIGGTGAGEIDQLIVTGTSTLDGLLSIDFLNGFVPSESDSFAFLTADAFSGSFDRVIAGSGTFDVATDGRSLVLTNYQIPEPSAAFMTMAIGTATMLRRRRLR